jgi:hypothetical protein
LFSRGGQREEGDVLAQRLARGAGRFAINTGGADGVDEAAVSIFVTSEYGGPFGAWRILRSTARAIRFRFAPRISSATVRHVFDLRCHRCFVEHGDKISKLREANYPLLAVKVGSIAFAFAMWESGGKRLN